MSSEITGIPEKLLTQKAELEQYSIGQRISWAAKRTTTRKEDEAYCLLGLLEVNMPLLYGEGRMAFRRLQQLVFDQTADETILAFQNVFPNPERYTTPELYSLFAPSVGHFARHNDYADYANNGNVEIMHEYRAHCPTLTPWGLKLESSATVVEAIVREEKRVATHFVVRLACDMFCPPDPSLHCYLVLTEFLDPLGPKAPLRGVFKRTRRSLKRQGTAICYREPIPYFAGQPEGLVQQYYNARGTRAELRKLEETENMTFYINVHTDFSDQRRLRETEVVH